MIERVKNKLDGLPDGTELLATFSTGYDNAGGQRNAHQKKAIAAATEITPTLTTSSLETGEVRDAVNSSSENAEVSAADEPSTSAQAIGIVNNSSSSETAPALSWTENISPANRESGHVVLR